MILTYSKGGYRKKPGYIRTWSLIIHLVLPCFQGMRPQNRYRSNQSSMVCSRCTSVMSVNNSRMTSRCTSQMSLHHLPSMHRKPSNAVSSPKTVEIAAEQPPPILCKICLVDCPIKDTYKLQQCRCIFCKEVSIIFVMAANSLIDSGFGECC